MTDSQVVRQLRRSAIHSLLYQLLFLLPWTLPMFGQASASVPHLVRFSGAVSGNFRSGIVGVTFALYKEEQGGSPLWLETQNVRLDTTGHYSVYLGLTKSEGLPQELFVTGEARWLGVQVEGQAEQARTLLLSVPYALKAGDAETVGGLPASAFVLAAPNGGSAGSGASGTSDSGSPPPVGGSGTQNFIPLWTDNSGTLGNSVMFQSGTGSSAKTGINTTTPASTLDVNGSVIARGPVQLPSTGTATAGGGFTSQPLSLQGSSFNSSNQQAIGPLFQWQTEPTGNNSSSPAGTLNLLYGNGSGSPGETGLNIASNGRIAFASGQTFPGTGTITGVTAGTGLTGGGTSGNVTLGINIPFANQFYAQLGAANTFTKNQTVNANLIAKQLISTASQGTMPLQVTSNTLVPNLNASLLGGLSASAFQPAGSYASLGANTFNGDQNVTGNVSASAAVNAGTGFNLAGNTFAFGDFSNLNVFLGFAGNSTNTGQGNTATGWRALHSDTNGGSNTASGARALSANITGNENTANGSFGLYLNTTGSDNTATGMQTLYSNIGGNSNSAAGAYALQFNTTGNYNTGDGAQALNSNTVGFQNTASGAMALFNNTTGINNTALGFNAGPDANSPSLTNATAIGANAVVGASNALVLGGTGTNAVNVGIGTAIPSSTLDVRGTGNFTGQVTFAPGQTFPGTGTITGVTAGTDLVGGGSTGNVTLNVDTTKVVTGVAAGTDLTGGGTGGVQTLNLDTTKVPQLNTANAFTGNQTVNGNLTATGVVSGSGYQIGNTLFAFGSDFTGNAFFGFAGNSTMTGYDNLASGPGALANNTTGIDNIASGLSALVSNTTGSSNTAIGAGTLFLNTTGQGNTGSGLYALQTNTVGNYNTANGLDSLLYNTTGSNNSALGVEAGDTTNAAPTTGSSNTFVGAYSSPGTQTNLNNATAIGANAEVTVSNALVLGSIAGVNGATADTLVGIGTTAPTYKLHLGNSIFSFRVEGPFISGTTGLAASFGGYGDFGIDAPGIPSGRFVMKENGKMGIGSSSPSNILTVGQGKGSAIADGWTTYSSRRWKTNIQTLPDALAKVEQLRGVSYDLKQSGKHEIGVIAEEVGAVVPEVVTWEKNRKDAQSVDYGRLTALLIEATKEQQMLIHKQQQQIKAQQVQVKTQQAQLARLASQVTAIRTLLKANGAGNPGVRTVKATTARR